MLNVMGQYTMDCILEKENNDVDVDFIRSK